MTRIVSSTRRQVSESEALADIAQVLAQVDIHTAREIYDSTAVTIAAWYASPGAVGRHLAELSTTAGVDLDELLDDIAATRRQLGRHDDSRSLDVLATWAIQKAREADSEDIALDVCVDCMLANVNDETPEDCDREPWSAFAESRRTIVPDFDDDDGHDEFSRVRCDGCGSTLAGERFAFLVIPFRVTVTDQRSEFLAGLVADAIADGVTR